VSLARASKVPGVQRECATILENMRQFPEAAALYEAAELWDRAGAIHIAAKNYAAVKPMMDRGLITTPKLYVQYARAREAEGSYKEAAAAYERAGDLTAVVRLQIEKLDAGESAFALVRRTRSVEGAMLIARHCLSHGNHRAAIEFLLLGNAGEEALDIAKRNDLVAVYADLVKDEGSAEQFRRIAEWFEAQGRPGDAGTFYAKCGDAHRALRLFLQAGSEERYILEAIAVVGASGDEVLQNTLVDWLVGETDGQHKEPRYIFLTYIALGKYPEATRTALAIAAQEQELGNYKQARDLLLETHTNLTRAGVPVPRDLTSALCLLHSYLQVKPVIVLGDHATAARLLLRVARSISRFPAHQVQILTTTVIETRRAGLKRSAFEYASTLMRPETRGEIKEAFRKNIDHIARKPVRTEDEEPATACPHCAHMVAESRLDCPKCLNVLPFCTVTGRHMVAHDWAQCEQCSFPALHSALTAYLGDEKASAGGKCPMCSMAMQGSPQRYSEDEVRAILAGPAAEEQGSSPNNNNNNN
jgi:WD repeat-containing protein 19